MNSALNRSATAQQLAAAEIIGEVRDGSDRDLRGWENRGEHTMSCMTCDRPLVHLVVVNDEDIKMTYVADCPCGDTSFKKRVSGRVIFGPVGDLIIDDVVSEKDSAEERSAESEIIGDTMRFKDVSINDYGITRFILKCKKTTKT